MIFPQFICFEVGLYMNDCNIMGGWVLLAVSRSKQKTNLDL